MLLRPQIPSTHARPLSPARMAANQATVQPPDPVAATAAACVYILRCGDGSLYTGWTIDVDRRLAAHASGRGARYTRSRLPIELVATLPMSDAQAARREEARIKRMPRREKLALLASLR